MLDYQTYERTIQADTEESLSKIANKIADNSIVLDIGCCTGMLGRYLSQNKGCIVDGVDFDENAIEICRADYRFTAIKNFESDSLTDVFETELYDYIVVADVVEHLVNPDKLLLELKQLIKPEGTIIFSVPNVTHIAVGFELLFGHFNYSDNGLLDNTHLRFYSKKNLLSKLEAFGLYPWDIDTVQKEIAETEFSNTLGLFPKQWVDELISSREDALTYQWIISTKTYPLLTSNNNNHTSPATDKPLRLFSSILYWTDKENNEFSKQKKLIGHVTGKNKEFTVIDFYFSECNFLDRLQKIQINPVTGLQEITVNPVTGLQQMRLNPVTNIKYFLIANAEILDAQKNVVWSWQPQSINEAEFYGAYLVSCFDSQGALFEVTSDNPQWYPTINENITSQITSGWTFRLSLKIDAPLVNELIQQVVKYQQLQNDSIKQITAINEQITAIHGSTSWLVTTPLRLISKVLKRIAT